MIIKGRALGLLLGCCLPSFLVAQTQTLSAVSKTDIDQSSTENSIEKMPTALPILKTSASPHPEIKNIELHTQEKDQQEKDQQKDPNLYTDNFLSDKTIDQDFSTFFDHEEKNTKGRYREFSAEIFNGRSSSNGSVRQEMGGRISGGIGTTHYGVWSVDITANTQKEILKDLEGNNARERGFSQHGNRLTLKQRDFYLTDTILMENDFGVTQTPNTTLMNKQTRFYFPSVVFEGVRITTTTPKQTQFQLSSGKAGFLTGGRYAGFEKSGGDIQKASVSIKNDDWFFGGGAFYTKGNTYQRQLLNNFYMDELFPLKSHSLYASVGRETAESFFQVNILKSHGVYEQPQDKQTSKQATGIWLDGRYAPRNKPLSYAYGAFYLQDNLLWGAFPVISDTKGFYGRITYQRPRTTMSVGLDKFQSFSSNGFNGWYSSSYIRYQRNPLEAYGGNISFRKGNDDTAYALSGYTDRRNRFGSSRLLLEYSGSTGKQQSNNNWQVGVDQAWKSWNNLTWTTSFSYGVLSDDTSKTKLISFGNTGTWKLTENTILSGTARMYRSQNDSRYSGNDINLSLEHNFNSNLTASVAWFESRNNVRSPFNIDPIYQEDIYSRYHDKTLYLSLRYNFQAGRRPFVLSRKMDVGSFGTIEGVAFLDENGDGTQQSNEEILKDAKIVLDGIYVTSSDEKGRYSFGNVGIGKHTLNFIEDELPLPWKNPNDKVIVLHVRDRKTILIGAVKENSNVTP